MAFMKYASAKVVAPSVSWDSKVRTASGKRANLVNQAEKIFGGKFNPDDYLLTHCFPAGHMVMMGDGTEKPIEDVEVGDMVITHEGNVKPVTRLLRKEVDENLVVVKSASLPEIACTGNHPFYVIPEAQSWCRVFPSYQGNVKCTFGEKQVCSNNSCLTNGAEPQWVDACDLKVGDRTYTPTLHETRVPKNMNPNRMRLLGYYVAEGRVDKDHKGRLHSIRFSIHTDEVPTLGAEIARLMSLEFGIDTHSKIVDKERPNCTTLAFHSHEHAPFFIQHGGCGSREKILSLDVLYAPTEWQKQFVGAWINGDGCYDGLNSSVSKGIRLATSSKDLASQGEIILDRLGVYSRQQRVVGKAREYKGRIIKGFDGWHLCVPSTDIKKLSDVVHWDFSEVSDRYGLKQRYRYVASVLSRIESIGSRSFKGTVYNLSVQDDESYLVNRQAVHNCTIVASVDTEDAPNVRLGSITENGKKINRKYANYLITPNTSKYVNNNGDSWDRDVLMKSYKTFIGSHNFQEHVQIEDLSKGRIIDAVARDIGDSVYVDILVATDRKHTQLVEDIQSGRLGTLSMGCTVDSTICTKCGNVAVDDTEFCDHVKYEKRNTFIDQNGKKRIVAELCGHPDMGDTAGVTFIEASWVAVPAFTGAVMRNILSTDDVSAELSRKASEILSVPPAEWSDEASKKVAKQVVSFGFDDDDGDDEGGDPKSPMDELEDEMVDVVKKRVLQRLKNEFNPKDKEKNENPPKPEDSTTYQNDTVIKEATLRKAHAMGQKLGVLQGIAKVSHTREDFIDGIALLDNDRGSSTSVSVYRASLKVGSVSKYATLRSFLLASKKALGGTMTPSDARQMIRLARLLDFWSAQKP